MAAVLDWLRRRGEANRRRVSDVADRALAIFAGDSYFEAFRAIPVGVALVGPNGAWLDVNDAVCRIVGRTRAELEATTFQAITTHDAIGADTKLVAECLLGTRDGYAMHKTYVCGPHHEWRREGDRVPIVLKVDVVRERSGAVRHFISTIVDLEELNRWAAGVPGARNRTAGETHA